MATLTAWKFNTPNGADDALLKLEKLQSDMLIQLHDAAVVSWDVGRKKPKTHEMHNVKAAGALGGAFWGLLFGLIFFIPILGLAVGAASGALLGSMRDVGIDDECIREVRDKVTPGTSALFALTSGAVYDRSRPIRRHAGRAHPHQPVGRAGSQAPRGLRRGTTDASAFRRRL